MCAIYAVDTNHCLFVRREKLITEIFARNFMSLLRQTWCAVLNHLQGEHKGKLCTFLLGIHRLVNVNVLNNLWWASYTSFLLLFNLVSYVSGQSNPGTGQHTGALTCLVGLLTGLSFVHPWLYSDFHFIQNVLWTCIVLIVDIKGPKKIFPDLPFGNMDSDRVEARKSLLETFLKVRRHWPLHT